MSERTFIQPSLWPEWAPNLLVDFRPKGRQQKPKPVIIAVELTPTEIDGKQEQSGTAGSISAQTGAQEMKHCPTCRCNEHAAPRQLIVGGAILNVDTHTMEYGLKAKHLSAINFRLATALASVPGALHKRGDLYRAGWGYDDAGTRGRSVDIHIGLIRRILKDIGAPLQIAGVRGVGYRLDVRIGEDEVTT